MLIATLGRRTHFVNQLREAIESAIVNTGRGCTSGGAFQRRANWVDLDEIVERELSNTGTVVRGAHDETEHLEIPERLTNGRLTDAKLSGQPQLVNPRTGCEPTAKDVLSQPFADFIAKEPPFNRA